MTSTVGFRIPESEPSKREPWAPRAFVARESGHMLQSLRLPETDSGMPDEMREYRKLIHEGELFAHLETERPESMESLPPAPAAPNLSGGQKVTQDFEKC